MSKIYLYTNFGWQIFDSNDSKELENRNITIGDGAIIGDRAKIGNNAIIGDGAIIGDRAKIGNNAIIGDGAKIGNDAIIGDRAIIGNDAIIGDGAKPICIFINGSRNYVCYWGENNIQIGCKQFSIDYWLENYAEIGEMQSYTKSEIEEYKQYIDIINQIHSKT
jgi:NDP-sugar pyrophosphorylase family protein